MFLKKLINMIKKNFDDDYILKHSTLIKYIKYDNDIFNICRNESYILRYGLIRDDDCIDVLSDKFDLTYFRMYSYNVAKNIFYDESVSKFGMSYILYQCKGFNYESIHTMKYIYNFLSDYFGNDSRSCLDIFTKEYKKFGFNYLKYFLDLSFYYFLNSYIFVNNEFKNIMFIHNSDKKILSDKHFEDVISDIKTESECDNVYLSFLQNEKIYYIKENK